MLHFLHENINENINSSCVLGLLGELREVIHVNHLKQYLVFGVGGWYMNLFCFLSLKLLALHLHSIPQKDKCRQVHDLNEEEDKIRHKRQVESFLTVLDLGM